MNSVWKHYAKFASIARYTPFALRLAIGLDHPSHYS